ncbi:MAG: hypothetical protein H0X16_12175 [Chloroflexi bacterium]|nr:hypothetical protein [Chloroflexota bacterium]
MDLAASLEPFRRWGDDRLDRFDGRVVVRTVPLPTGAAAFSARIEGTIEQPALVVEVADEAATPEVAAAAATMVVGGSLGELTERDPVLGALDRRFPGVRPVLQFDLLASLVRAISAQQVNLRWAARSGAGLQPPTATCIGSAPGRSGASTPRLSPRPRSTSSASCN